MAIYTNTPYTYRICWSIMKHIVNEKINKEMTVEQLLQSLISERIKLISLRQKIKETSERINRRVRK